MARVTGPILGFRGQQSQQWRVAIMVAHEGGTTPGALSYGERGQASAPAVQPSPIGEVGGAAFFAYEIAIAMQAAERIIEYGFAGESGRWTFAVPGKASRCASPMDRATAFPCRGT